MNYPNETPGMFRSVGAALLALLIPLLFVVLLTLGMAL